MKMNAVVTQNDGGIRRGFNEEKSRTFLVPVKRKMLRDRIWSLIL